MKDKMPNSNAGVRAAQLNCWTSTKALLVLAVISWGAAQARDLPAPIHQSGKLPSGVRYELHIEESAYHHLVPTQKDSQDGSFWGVDGGFPDSVITTFEFRLNGKDVYIPRKFYSDLSDAHTVKVEVRKNGIVAIQIEGSDAAGAYECEMLFRNNRLIERMTRVGEFSDDVWERVILHNDLRDHPEKY